MTTPTEVINHAADNIADAARAITDPIERARQCEAALTALGRLTSELGAARREAVKEARQRMSAVELAAALGVTRARVYQILDAG